MLEEQEKNNGQVEETTKDIDIEQDDALFDENQEVIESEDSEQSDDKDIDYKAELENLQGLLAQKNERISKQDKKILKLKKRSQDEDFDEIEEEDDEETKIHKAVEQQMTSFVEDTIEEEINKVASNEDEGKLIRWYFDNRIIKESWSKKAILDYISDAKALANKNKLTIKSKVLEKKQKSDETAGKPNYTGIPPKKSSEKYTAYDKKMADKFFKGDLKKWKKYGSIN